MQFERRTMLSVTQLLRRLMLNAFRSILVRWLTAPCIQEYWQYHDIGVDAVWPVSGIPGAAEQGGL